MLTIVAFKKIPRTSNETKKFLFGDREELDDGESSEEERRRGDLQTWPTKMIAELFFENVFSKKNRKVLDRDAAVKLIRGFDFPGRPRYKDFPNKANWRDHFYIDWEKYFKAELEAAEKRIDDFMEKNPGCHFLTVDVGGMSIWGRCLEHDQTLKNFPYLKVY